MADDMRYPAAVAENIVRSLRVIIDRLWSPSHWTADATQAMTRDEIAKALQQLAEEIEHGGGRGQS